MESREVVGRQYDSRSFRGRIRDSSSRRRFGFDLLIVVVAIGIVFEAAT
jgi:hypothetical protein